MDILRRQEAAQKLETCTCGDDKECAGTKRNLQRLCYPEEGEEGGVEDNEIEGSSGAEGARRSGVALALVLGVWIYRLR